MSRELNKVFDIVSYTFNSKSRSLFADLISILIMLILVCFSRFNSIDSDLALTYKVNFFFLIFVSLGLAFHHGLWTSFDLYQRPDKKYFWLSLPINLKTIFTGKILAILLRIFAIESVLVMILIFPFKTGIYGSLLFLLFLFLQSAIFLSIGFLMSQKPMKLKNNTFLEIFVILPVVVFSGLIPFLIRDSSFVTIYKLFFPFAWIYTSMDVYIYDNLFPIIYLWLGSILILILLIWLNIKAAVRLYR